MNGLISEAADAIEELNAIREGQKAQIIAMAAEEKPHWIPVTERMPEENGSYLVYVYGEVTEMNCWHGIWHRFGDNYTKNVTHWMPMPDPPKEAPDA